MGGPVDHLGPVPRKPGELRRVHLGRDLAAYVTQGLVSAGVDPVRFPCGAMVHPDDHVPLRRARRTHRQRAAVAVEHDQRAGRVKAHAGDRFRSSPRRLDGLAHRRGHRAPDVVGRLFDDFAGLAPDGDGPPGAGDEAPRSIENAGSRTERTDVNPNKPAHGVSGALRSRRILRFGP